MKKTLALCLLSVITFASPAQQSTIIDCNCHKPKPGKFIKMCTLVENQDFAYKKLLMEMSCADPTADSRKVISDKVQCMFKKYYSEFGCDNTGFLVPQGNILKYAVNQEFDYFIDGVVKDFGIDINIKDPADNKTLLDFVLDEIKRYKKYPDFIKKVKELEEVYDHLKNNLKAKHASEL